MDDLSSLPFANGNHYANNGHDSETFDDDDETDENDQLSINDQADDDIIDHHQLEVEQERQVQPVQTGRGSRRKGVPRRLQLSPEVVKAPTQRLLPLSLSKSSTSGVHHHEQPILTSDQEDENEPEDTYQQNQVEQNYLQLDLLSKQLTDSNNNHYEDSEDILETVDDMLADMVAIIVRDIKQQRRKATGKLNGHTHHKQPTNGLSSLTNGKHSSNGYSETKSTKSQSKSYESSASLHEPSRARLSNSQQSFTKQKRSPPSSVSSSPIVKRQKTSEPSSHSSTSLSIQQQHQQLLWEMTQQLMMSTVSNDADSLAAVNSSLLKQQLLGLTQQDAMPKPKSRSSKPQAQSPVMQPMASSASSSLERGNFAPRRRGRPPKYVTDRGLGGLSSMDLDPSGLTSSYDQLLSALENGMAGSAVGPSSAAFQSALASMLGQQAALAMPPAPVARNGTPASMLKNSAGQSRHSLPASSMTHATKVSHGGLDMPLMATKKRGPGRPPKTQTLFDSHQILQATQRLNSSANSNHFPPTMVPSAASSFNLNAAFVEMLQQQHQQQHHL